MVGGIAGLIVLGTGLPILAAAAVLVGFSPFALIGLRLVQRHRVGSR